MRALVLTQWDSDATYYYRLKPLFYIDHPRIKIERKPYHGEITYSFFDGYDVLILERPSGVHDLHVIKLAKQCGLKIVSDFDDDILHLPEMNPMFHVYEDAKQTVCECIAESDQVWVSTQGVKRSFTLLNQNITVIPNSHDDYLQKVENKKPFNPNEKKVIWRGGGSHQPDVYEKGEFIVDMVNKNPDWMFYFLGDRFIWLEQRCGKNYQPVSQMPLMQYFEFLSTLNCQIQFHPLNNTIFNKSKSNIALIESAYAGSVFLGNQNLPEFNKPGTGDISDLINAFEFNTNTLSAMNNDSWQYVKEHLLLSKVNKLRINNLLNL